MFEVVGLCLCFSQRNHFSPQAPDKHGLTPLISACFEGHTSCVKVLLEKVGAFIFNRASAHTSHTGFPPASAPVDVSEGLSADE